MKDKIRRIIISNCSLCPNQILCPFELKSNLNSLIKIISIKFTVKSFYICGERLKSSSGFTFYINFGHTVCFFATHS